MPRFAPLARAMWLALAVTLLLLPTSTPLADGSGLESDLRNGPATAAEPLTLNSLLQFALLHNPTIQAATADVNKAQGFRWHVTRRPNPSVGYSASEVGNEGGAGQQGMFFSQEIVTANKLGLNDQIAGWDVERFNWLQQGQQLRVIGDVRQRFYAVLAARQQREILIHLDQILDNTLRLTQQLVDAGEIGQAQLLQAQFERQQNRMILSNQQRIVAATEQALAATVGVPQLNLSSLSGRLEAEVPQFDLESGWRELVTAHPLLESARAAALRQQWNVHRQQVESIPNLATQFLVQHDDITESVIAGVQVTVQLPINNRNQGMIAAANADSIRASQEVRRQEFELRQRYAETFRQYSVASEQIAVIQAELLPLAEENLRTMQDLYRLGEASYLNLLTSQRAYIEVSLSLVKARQDAWQAVALIETGLMSDALKTPP